MTLSTDNLKSACLSCRFIKLDIRTTSRHVGCDCNSTVLTCLRNYLSLHLVELGIEDIMLNSSLLEKIAHFLRLFDGNCTYKHRLSLLMSGNHILHNRMKLLFSCLINNIVIVNSRNRSVGRNLYNIHSVDFAELLLLSKGSTCHT